MGDVCLLGLSAEGGRVSAQGGVCGENILPGDGGCVCQGVSITMLQTVMIV